MRDLKTPETTNNALNDHPENPQMMNKVCRVGLLPATNAGITAATANAGLEINRPKQLHGGRRVETASSNASRITTHTKES